MKRAAITLFSFVVLAGFQIEAAAQQPNGALHKNDLQKIFINGEISLHFVSPEPIQYVDISTDALKGDIPIANICRIKPVTDSIGYKDQSLGVVTIVGQKFIAQYDVWHTSEQNVLESQVEILPSHTNPLDVGAAPLSENELREFAIQAYKNRKSSYSITNTDHGITGRVNNIYTLDDYILLDVTYINNSNLKFDLDQVRFMVEDQKILKATNVQSFEIEPVYQLYDLPSFKRKYRNIYVLKKFSFPNHKMLSIALTESQISGRRLILEVGYDDLLNADTF